MVVDGRKWRLASISILTAVILVAVVFAVMSLHPQSDNELPVASFTHANDFNSLSVTFNASGSYDPDGLIADYSWSFGDGTTGTGVVTTHVYLSGGTYETVLKVTDDGGGMGQASEAFFVNIRPIVDLDVVYASGFTVVLSGANSHDPDGGSLEFEWIFYLEGESAEDSTVVRHAYEVEVTHVFDVAGDYLVYLGVTDDEGITSSTFYGFQIPIGG